MSFYFKSNPVVTVAQILMRQGYESVEENALYTLTNALTQYLRSIGQTLHHCIEHAGRTKINYDDILTTFNLIGVNLKEIQRFASYNIKWEDSCFLSSIDHITLTKLFEKSIIFVNSGHNRRNSLDYIPDFFPPQPPPETWHNPVSLVTNGKNRCKKKIIGIKSTLMSNSIIFKKKRNKGSIK